VKYAVLEIARFHLGLAGLVVVHLISVQKNEQMAHLVLLSLVDLTRARSSIPVKSLYNRMSVVSLVLVPPKN